MHFVGVYLVHGLIGFPTSFSHITEFGHGVAITATAIGTALINAEVDPSGRHRAMDAVERSAGSVGAMLIDMTNLPDVPRGWSHRDERYRLMPFLERQGVTTELDLITPEDVDGSAYYREFLAPLRLRWYAAVKAAAGDQFWAALSSSGRSGKVHFPQTKCDSWQSSPRDWLRWPLFPRVGNRTCRTAFDAINASGCTSHQRCRRQAAWMRSN